MERVSPSKVPGARGLVLPPTASEVAGANGKYSIYSSKSTEQKEGDVRVLDKDTNVDNFVGFLPSQKIVLKGKPTADNLSPKFDESDNWAKWMTNVDVKGSFSVTFDDAETQNLQSFDFALNEPWNINFSSSTDALNFSFGGSGLMGANNRIPVPGMFPDGNLLYCGMRQADTKDIQSTVKELYDFAGVITAPPDFAAKWKVGLKPRDAAGKRNGLWFAPAAVLSTYLRLQFSLDEAARKEFQAVMASALKEFSLEEVDVICRRQLNQAETGKGSIAVENGRIVYQARARLTPNNKPPVNVTAGIECTSSTYSMILRLESDDALANILAWLTDQIGAGDLDDVSDILGNSDIFKAIKLRQLKVDLAVDPDDAAIDRASAKPKLVGFSVDIEASVTFGGGSGSGPAVFLVSCSWTKGLGMRITGDFWNWFDTSKIKDLDPNYEELDDLRPLEKEPALQINLPSMIPGQTIQNVPKNIPTAIDRAHMSLTKNDFFIGASATSTHSQQPDDLLVPQLDLGEIGLYGSISWAKKAEFTFGARIVVDMSPGPHSKHSETAMLVGSVDYDSRGQSWHLSASLQGLYASTLYEFFDPSAAGHVMPLIDSLEVANMNLDYVYTKDTAGPGSVGSSFKFDGQLLIAALELDLHFEYQKDSWSFDAKLAAQKDNATVGDILQSILDDEELDLPAFIANEPFNGGKDGNGDAVHIVVKASNSQGTSSGGAVAATGKPKPGSAKSFQFVATINFGPIELMFAQLHGEDWLPETPSKRLVKASLTKLPTIDIQLIGKLEQPFDELAFAWIQDGTNRNPGKVAGLTRQDIADMNPNLGAHYLVSKDKSKDPSKPDDVLMTAGAHLIVVIKDAQNKKMCVLDYNFKRQQNQQPKPKSSSRALVSARGRPASSKPKKKDKTESDGSSDSAPYKKKVGPLSISNIGLKYADKILHIKFDAMFELGPLGFSLLGFSIDLQLESFRKIPRPGFSLEGLAVDFEKSPLTIAGIIRRGHEDGLDYYAGGLIVGFTPYQLQAAGFYGEATPEGGGSTFKSVFLFARFDGPLLTLEFAEISGVTGGFGYNSEVRLPAPDQITNFPFIAPTALTGATGSAMEVLQRLTSPKADGWFHPLDDTYWAAAGMKIDAFQMISLDAVVVVQFGQSIKLGIFADALVDIPDAQSKLKFAHVELGIAIVVDFDFGVLKAEAQLSPRSFILDPSCRLEGGFALYYWFDAPHADHDNIGNFVFTLGGYNAAFRVPAGWPNPPRLSITWGVGGLKIRGEAYFAITPKVCMGGGHLRADYNSGSIHAWFDAEANFLIKYKPFHFNADAHISVGAEIQINLGLIHGSIGGSIGADLYLWGPPVAGKVHVKILFFSFDIYFGHSDSDVPALSMDDFYLLVLQVSSKLGSAPAAAAAAGLLSGVQEKETGAVLTAEARAKNEAHTFLAQSGLMEEGDKSPDRGRNQDWVVRGGTFSFVLGCKMAIGKATQVSSSGETMREVSYTQTSIYAKPMQLTTPLDSTVQVQFVQEGLEATWGMSPFMKSVPTALWAVYDGSSDPANGGNKIHSLLDNKDGSVNLMMGVLLTAPPPTLSPDPFPVFDIVDAELRTLHSEKKFPGVETCQSEWDADEPTKDEKQWDSVCQRWEQPLWDSEQETTSSMPEPDIPEKNEAEGVQQQFVQRWLNAFQWEAPLVKVAKMPRLLTKRFGEIHVAAPLMTK